MDLKITFLKFDYTFQLDLIIIEKCPKLIELISKSDLNSYQEIKNCLIDLNISFFEDQNLVRGLDYYCHTVFEFKTDEIGTQDTLIGGGRYDGLIKTLGGKNIPGVGWAGGIERIMLLMKDIVSNEQNIHLAIKDPTCKKHALEIYDFLVKNNFVVYWNYKYNLKKSLSKANEMNAKFIIIIGDETFKKELYSIKDLTTGEQIELSLENIKKFINDKS